MVDEEEDPLHAVLDVGSNTIRLLVASSSPEGDFAVVRDENRFVRLGAGVEAGGELRLERRNAAVRAIDELAAMARESGATDLRAVATSAVRDARNGHQFAQDVLRETGVTIDILSGAEEARLTFLGSTAGLDISRGAIIADIGGGSSEIIGSGPDGVHWARSFQLGSGRMTDQFIRGDPPSGSERHAVEECAGTFVRQLPKPTAPLAVFTGGTATNVAILASGAHEVVTPISLGAIKDVERLAYELTTSVMTDRHGMRPERATVFPAGATILRVIAEWSAASEFVITRHGIREGVIVDALKGNRPG